MDHFKKGMEATSVYPDLISTLSNSDLLLTKYFHRIEIPGKRERKVPVILSKKHVEYIHLLLKFTNNVGVSPKKLFIS